MGIESAFHKVGFVVFIFEFITVRVTFCKFIYGISIAISQK